MTGRFFSTIALIAAVLSAPSGVHAAPIDAYLAAAAERVPGRAQNALSRIEGAPRKLLALRSYLRAGDDLTTRWSWTHEQIETFRGTPEHARFIAEVDRVRAAFDAQNPGFTLVANTEVRSLETQLERWNTNDGVARVARSLHAAAAAELSRPHYPKQPDPAATERFATFLNSWRPASSAPLAAPGLSRHGQLRAIDFHVERDGRLIASTTMASVEPVWEAEGWSRKLQRAARGTSFVGPLKSPNEPWHYEYHPNDTE